MGKSKTCKRCKQRLPIEQFGTRGKTEKGATAYDPRCRPCAASLRREQRAEQRTRALTDASEHDYGTTPLPDGFTLRGVSQFVTEDGRVKAQWIKSERTREKGLQAFTDALLEMLEPYRARAEAVPPPAPPLDENLINVVPVGDAHVGLFTWWQETGENFDLPRRKRRS
jgi:hypothetical protein